MYHKDPVVRAVGVDVGQGRQAARLWGCQEA